MTEKTCKKCGFTGDRSLFVIDENTCKACRKKERAIYYQQNKQVMDNRSKIYRETHKEELTEYSKNYRKVNKNSIKLKQGKYFKKYYAVNKEKIDTKNNAYAHTHRKQIRENGKKWFQSPIGREFALKRSNRRRKLGHEPINSWFKGCEEHHLRYSNTHTEQDNSITLYVPRKLHRSIKHNGRNGKGMREINIACLEWYFKTTPKEKQNLNAAKLYNNYLILPEPEWR